MIQGKILGTVTVGQAPRPDITNDLAKILGPSIEIVEAGALDGITPEEIKNMAPKGGEETLVTRLANGSVVTIAAKHVYPRLEDKITELFAKGASLVAILCTSGEFLNIKSNGIVLRPLTLEYNVVRAVGACQKIGVIYPVRDQLAQAKENWKRFGREQVVLAASPFGNPAELTDAAEELKEAGAELVVMDCIGYTLEMQEKVRKITGVPVLLARGILGRIIKEMLG